MRNSVISFFASSSRSLLALTLILAIGAASFGAWTVNAQGGRVIRCVNVSTQQGQQVIVEIQIDSQGNESSASFTVNFDPTKLSSPLATIGNGVPAGSALGTNQNQVGSGRLGILIDSTNTYAAGTRQMMTIRFNVAAGAPSGGSTVSFGSTPTFQSVSSASGALLTTTYQSGTVTIGTGGPTPTPTPTSTPTPTPNPTPTPTPTPNPTPTPTPNPTPTPTPNPTPTPTPNPTPTPTPNPTPTPTPNPTPTPTPNPTPTPTPNPTPTPTPNPTPTPTPTPSPTPNTPPGTNVFVQAPDSRANITFGTVFQTGNTTFTQIPGSSAGFPPNGYTLANEGLHFNVMTSAIFGGSHTVCIVAFGIDDPEDFARLRILHREGSQLIDRTILFPDAPAPLFATRQVCSRVDLPGDFYLAYGPTFMVSGRVLTPNGQGLRNAVVSITDSRGVRQMTTSSSFGAYVFANVRGGETYTISVSSRRYRFAARPIVVLSNLNDVDMIGLE
ncbi:MAG TPA: carboxypeptidase regulatory-like domain-containing protein [Pyrinomonadaceae bacterium]|nr:carboxypeptidase regulatory-like domain-containing protein [Pyrinomonadaceae bacterium]